MTEVNETEEQRKEREEQEERERQYRDSTRTGAFPPEQRPTEPTDGPVKSGDNLSPATPPDEDKG